MSRTVPRAATLGSAIVTAFLMLLGAETATAQIVAEDGPASLTVEGFANVTFGATEQPRSDLDPVEDSARLDAALRVLGRLHLGTGPDIGARVVLEGTNGVFTIPEASLLAFGTLGRIEVGKRMGLPDVLTGYAPNNFTFTSADFGPPSGLNLDPDGGLQTSFLRAGVASSINRLSTLGVAASLYGDQSPKILVVPTKRRGWLGGLSYSPKADDPRFNALVLAGLTHESYWHQNVFRWGGSYAFAQARDPGRRDLNSFGAGATVTFDDALTAGVGLTRDTGGELTRGIPGASASTAWGLTASVNYNSGPWTVGGYVQSARGNRDATIAGADHLAAVEGGVSYRITTKIKIYGAWLHFALHNALASSVTGSGDVALVGIRTTL